MPQIDPRLLHGFVQESNRIEGIHSVRKLEMDAHQLFLSQELLDVHHMQDLVKVLAGAPLRDREGLNVQVGDHIPPPGGPHIPRALIGILQCANDPGFDIRNHPFWLHNTYESLHPFMDGNGRSGRALWLWMMLKHYPHDTRPLRYGFLQTWYYQTLHFCGDKKHG